VLPGALPRPGLGQFPREYPKITVDVTTDGQLSECIGRLLYLVFSHVEQVYRSGLTNQSFLPQAQTGPFRMWFW
jgi:hypothetical protein